MKRADPTDQILVKASVARMRDRLLTREQAVQVAIAGRVVETGRSDNPVLAYVNEARWVADCPCGGSELVAEKEDMLCGSCGTVAPVKFPSKKKTEDIERLLNLRPPANQNWYPHETVDELLAQNIENDIWEGN